MEAAATAAAALGLLLALNSAAHDGWVAPSTVLLFLLSAAALAVWLRLPTGGSVVGELPQRAPAGAGAVLLALPIAMALAAQFGDRAATCPGGHKSRAAVD